MADLEIWADVVGFPTYQISSKGRFRRALKRGGYRILKNHHTTIGYTSCALFKNKKHYPKHTHRVVAEAFIPNPDKKPQVNHKNGIKTDNRVSNLEWVTVRENAIHASSMGLLATGERNGDSRLTSAQVAYVRSSNKPHSHLAIELGVSSTAIRYIRIGRTWKNVQT